MWGTSKRQRVGKQEGGYEWTKIVEKNEISQNAWSKTINKSHQRNIPMNDIDHKDTIVHKWMKCNQFNETNILGKVFKMNEL